MSNHDLEIVRSYGQGAVPLRFGFCPYGSTTAGTTQPFIPLVIRDPNFGSQPRWGGGTAVHDGQFVGRYNILLDDDWQDFVSNPEIRCNLNVNPASVLFPSTTTGSGVRITAVQSGPGILGTQPLTHIIVASGGAGTAATCAYVVATGVLTITADTSATNATVAAALNAYASYTGTAPTANLVSASVVGTSTDVFYVAALTVVMTGGTNSPDEQYASTSLATAGAAGITMVYTANQPGAAGNALSIVYAAGGAGTAASAAITGNTITLTIDTSATVNTLLTAINVTAIATVGKAITASFTATANTEGAIHTALATVAISSTTQNLSGTNLSGGGLLSARMSGSSVADAISKSSQWGVQFYHLNISVYSGDTLTDLNAQTELFIPSQGVLTSVADSNSGILFKSVATTATAATVNVISTSGGSNGLTFNANQPGDAGNNIFVIYANPLASLFIPSTTGGSGNTFVAVAAGTAGRGVQISMSVPTGAATVITVIGSSINIQPKASETVAGVTTAFNANAAAASLATASNTGTTSDLVTGGFGPQNLGGGYSQASGTASAVQTPNPMGGYNIIVTFGTNATNAQVETAVNGIPGAAVTAVALGTTTDHVVTTAATQLTGGADPSDLTVQYVFTGSSATTAVLTGNNMVVTIATTGDTNANIAAAVSSAGSNSMTAVVIGATADTNLPPQSDLVVSTTSNAQQLGAQNLACHNLVLLETMARKSMNGVV